MPNYPTSLDSAPTNPTGIDLLENTTAALDHNVQHNDAAGKIIAMETHLGIDNSLDPVSMEYLLRTGQLLEFRPTSANSMDDEFDYTGTTIDGKWTELNRGANSTADTTIFHDSCGIFTMPACTSGDKNRYWVQNAPTGVDYRVVMKCAISAAPADSGLFHAGLCLYDSAGGKVWQYGLNWRGGGYAFSDWKWNYPDTYAGNTFNFTWSAGYIYLGLQYDYTNQYVQWLFSEDGKTWCYRYIQYIGSGFFANRPDKVGITIMGNGLQKPAHFVVDWFRRIL